MNHEKSILENYVEGYEYLGKQIERKRDKTLDIVTKEFIVNTSDMNTPLAQFQNNSIRQLEASMMNEASSLVGSKAPVPDYSK